MAEALFIDSVCVKTYNIVKYKLHRFICKGVIHMKFLQVIQDRFKSIFHTWVRFPVVFVLLFATAVYISIGIEYQNRDYSREISSLALCLFISAVMTMGFEKTRKPLMFFFLSQAVALGLGAAYYFLVLAHYEGTVADSLRTLILCIALLLTFLWIPCLRWKSDFNAMFMSFFKAFFTTVFFMGIIYGGVAAVLAAVNQLLFRLPSNLFGHVGIWIMVFFAPMLLLSLIPVFGGTEEDTSQQEHLAKIPPFFRALLSYVLIPLTILYTLVLLAYLFKTLFGGDQQDLLRPLIMWYCVAVILLYVLVSGIENKISVLFRLIFPKLMLLIALYQAVTLISKIPSEGLVYSRYFVILFSIYSIAAGILMTLLPLKKNAVLAIVLTGFALVSVTPPVDAFTYSTASQVQLVEQVLNNNGMIKDGAIVPDANLSENDRTIVISGMEYLYEIKETDRIAGIPADFDYYNDFQDTFGFSPYDVPVQTGTSYYYSLDTAQPVGIAGYDHMVTVSAGSYAYMGPTSVLAAVSDGGKQYDITGTVDGAKVDISLRDPEGKVLLSASVNDMIDSIVKNGAAGEKELTSPEMMTFDVTGTDASMRIIFQNAVKDESTTPANYDGTMIILLRFN